MKLVVQEDASSVRGCWSLNRLVAGRVAGRGRLAGVE